MRRSLTIFCACSMLAACAEPRETILVTPSVPAALRQPVPVPSGPILTDGDLAVRAIELRAALGTANDRISAIDCILKAAETKRDAACFKRPGD